MPAIAFVTRRVYHDTEALIPYRTVNVSITNAKYGRNLTNLKHIARHIHDLCLELHADALQWRGATSCVVIPIPSSIWRMLRHGFNHMSTITQHLRSRALHIHDVLHSRNSPIRRTYTLDTPQATKSGVERKRDIPLFIPRQTRKIYSSTHCILVDDVVTTGSTFFGAEKALRAATNCRNVEKIAFAFSGFIESLGCDRFD